MPGIVGLITRLPSSTAQRRLARMLSSLSVEELYSTGTWAGDSLGVYVGWTALKNSFCDGMPLLDDQRGVCIVFSGEEYSQRSNEPDSGSPERRTTSSDSYYLLQRYHQNRNFIQDLNGLFHGLVADRNRDEVILFNDRYGMHRLCYHETADAFYFATEAKAILAVRPELRDLDYQSLGEFVSLSCILENRTLFKHIKVLPAGSKWTFRNGQLADKYLYFEPREWEEQTVLDPQSYYQQLRSVLTTNLPRYFGGDQTVGMAMTGGLDTRVLLASFPPRPGDLPTYTFGGPFRESRDVRVGRKVATVCRQSHKVIEVSEEFLAGFPEYAERTVFLSEGTLDVSRADLYLSRKAREIAPVKVVGTYGSEIVRHAVMFKPVEPPTGVFSPDFLPHLHRAASTYASVRKQHPVTFAAFRQSPWYHHGVLALEQSQLTVRSPFLDNDFVRTVYRAPREMSADTDVRLRLIRDGSSALARIPSDRAVGGDGGRLSSAIARAFQEFTFKAEYAYDYGMPQSVASIDHFFSWLHLERLFLGRHKLLHFRVWYRDQLSDYVRQMLLDPLTLSRSYLQKKDVETIVNAHLGGRRNYATSIHKLLTLELIQRLFVEAYVSPTIPPQNQRVASQPTTLQTSISRA
jgi:asparagine synthase (glutamine-hydrolysing)